MIKDVNVYGVKNRDKTVIEKSSSGGVIHEIVKYFINQQDIVCAASYDYDALTLKFKYIESLDDIDCIKGSKYIQARTEGLYKSIEEALSTYENKNILFIGLPCQCFAVKQYLEIKNISTERVYFIDIICHGVGNEEFLKYFIKKAENKITYINFKDKRRGWLLPYSLMKDCDGNEFSLDDYMTLYNKSLIIRPSCYNCKFSNLNRQGDITVGDFWNINNVNKDFSDSLGVSSILINSDKGKKIFLSVKENFEFFESNIKDVMQPNLINPTQKPSLRDAFWKDFRKGEFKYVINKYASKNLKNKIKRYILVRLKIWKV